MMERYHEIVDYNRCLYDCSAKHRIAALETQLALAQELIDAMYTFMPGMIMSADMGNCRDCGEATNSKAIKICRACTFKRYKAYKKEME